MSAYDSPPSAPPSLSDVRLRLATWLVTGAMLIELLDGTILTTALPSMAKSFGTTAVRLNIAVSAYLLAIGVFIPISGWIADRVGTRRVFATAIALFTASSVGCATAGSLVPFVAIRVVQGIAGAMMVPVGRLVILRFTPRERLMATMSALVWPALIAPVLGPPIGGFISSHFGWRWNFYLNLPLGLAAFAATLAIVPDVWGEQGRRFDLNGFVLSSAGTFALLSGLEWTVTRISTASMALVILGASFILLALRHFHRARDPMIDLTPYRIATFRASVRGGSLSRMSLGSTTLLLPLLFQVGFGYDAFLAGLLVLAVFAGNLVMKSGTTRVLRWFGYRNVMFWNGLVMFITIAGCALLRADTPKPLTFILLFAGGLSRSMQFTSLATLAFADVPKSQMNDANSLFNTVAQISLAVGITAGALCVHAGAWLAHQVGWETADAGYRLAFLLMGLVGVVGLLEVFHLPVGAGDSFLNRGPLRDEMQAG